jgi:hypothetical protein
MKRQAVPLFAVLLLLTVTMLLANDAADRKRAEWDRWKAQQDIVCTGERVASVMGFLYQPFDQREWKPVGDVEAAAMADGLRGGANEAFNSHLDAINAGTYAIYVQGRRGSLTLFREMGRIASLTTALTNDDDGSSRPALTTITARIHRLRSIHPSVAWIGTTS